VGIFNYFLGNHFRLHVFLFFKGLSKKGNEMNPALPKITNEASNREGGGDSVWKGMAG